MALAACKECGKDVSTEAQACPHCGAKSKKGEYGCGALLLAALGSCVVFGAVAIFGNSRPSPSSDRRPVANESAPMPNESLAAPDDLKQARKFLDDLPAACSGSYITISKDGTVIIHTVCSGASEFMSGTVSIKNGIVTAAE